MSAPAIEGAACWWCGKERGEQMAYCPHCGAPRTQPRGERREATEPVSMQVKRARARADAERFQLGLQAAVRRGAWQMLWWWCALLSLFFVAVIIVLIIVNPQ